MIYHIITFSFTKKEKARRKIVIKSVQITDKNFYKSEELFVLNKAEILGYIRLS